MVLVVLCGIGFTVDEKNNMALRLSLESSIVKLS